MCIPSIKAMLLGNEATCMNLQKLVPSKAKAFLSFSVCVSMFWGFYCSVSPHLFGLESTDVCGFCQTWVDYILDKVLDKKLCQTAPDLNIYKWCDQKLSTVNNEDIWAKSTINPHNLSIPSIVLGNLCSLDIKMDVNYVDYCHWTGHDSFNWLPCGRVDRVISGSNHFPASSVLPLMRRLPSLALCQVQVHLSSHQVLPCYRQ